MVMPIAGGIGLATRRDGGPDTVALAETYFDGLIRSSAEQAWTDYRPRLHEYLLAQLGSGDRIAPGVTLYDLHLIIPTDIDLSVEREDSGDLIVHVTTSGCYLEATSTTPTDLGSYADPRFSVAFGLDLTYHIELPPINGPLHATGFQSVHVLAPTLDSHNFAGDISFLINTFIDFFGGVNYVRMLERFVEATDFASYVDSALAPLNAELTRLASAGYWFLEAVVDRLDGHGSDGGLHGLSIPGARPGQLDLLLTAVGFDLSGAMEGEISWPKTLGAPVTRREAALSHPLARGATSLQLAAISAALVSERTRTWTMVTEPTSDFALTRPPSNELGTIIALPDSLAAGLPAAPAPVAAPATAAAEAAVSLALEAMPEPERLSAGRELRSGNAERFVSMVGGYARFGELQAEFRHGRNDFRVPVSVTVPGGAGLFPDEHSVGSVASLWAEDDETTYRRRFLVVDLPLSASLTVRCELSPDYVWAGPVDGVSCDPAGWEGSVTVSKAPPAMAFAEALGDQVEVRLPDHSRVFSRASSLEERGIIIVGGRPRIIDEVSLNPQPLPPQEIRGFDLLHGGASALVSRVERIQTVGTTVQLAAHEDRRWGTSVAELGEASADSIAVITAMKRTNPTGRGTVRGIDFRVEAYVPDVIR